MSVTYLDTCPLTYSPGTHTGPCSAEIQPTATAVARSVVCVSVCLSVSEVPTFERKQKMDSDVDAFATLTACCDLDL